MQTNEIETDDQHLPTPRVEGVTIHIEPMNDYHHGRFVVRLAVNGVIKAEDTVYGVSTSGLPIAVTNLLTRGATRWASERPEWISRAMVSASVGAFRRVFEKRTNEHG